MDPTRRHDIAELQAALRDPKVSEHHKKLAYRSLEKIKKQEELPWLHEERKRLAKAHAAEDQEAAERISYGIKRRMQEENV